MSIYYHAWRRFFKKNGGIKKLLDKVRDVQGGRLSFNFSFLSEYGNRKSYYGKVTLTTNGVLEKRPNAHGAALDRFFPSLLRRGELLHVSIRDSRSHHRKIKVVFWLMC